jgi:RimJ/RimL family protein N-acetyltransferase
MNIRQLEPSDANAFQTLRLQALRECPAAFLSSYEEECNTPPETIAGRFAPNPHGRTFGAFMENSLVGIVGLKREQARKFSHKGYLWGMYVMPEHRNLGTGRQLVLQALKFAESVPGLRQVNLFVTAANKAAITLYESVGFLPYGIERDSMLVDGEFYDEVLMVHRVQL